MDVQVPADDATLDGTLRTPTVARGVVAFAHGSGSSRHSPRNVAVAESLTERGFATLLFDLLTVEEDQVDRITRELRFDIPLLARRLAAAVDWLGQQSETRELPVGLFGASTGAAAALIAAARRPAEVGAVVSRGGRPDLADDALGQVAAPTLLIVGERDPQVLELNEEAARKLAAPCQMVVIPGATHLFEEPGAMDDVADYAGLWFERYVGLSSDESPEGE